MEEGRRPIGLGLGLSSERWMFGDVYITLDESLPEVTFIKALKTPNAARSIHPSAIGKIIASLPGLERLTLELNAPKTKRAEMQDEHRLCLAKALKPPSLSRLRILDIYIEQGVPQNHNFKNRSNDPSYPDGDALNTAIRTLAETRLTDLSLTGDWLVSPALFSGQEQFPHLKRVQIQGELMTYDARWYYTGDSNEVGSYDEDYGSDSDSGTDSDTNSSLNSEFCDCIPERREAMSNAETKWDVPEEIMTLWREIVGENGDISVETF